MNDPESLRNEVERLREKLVLREKTIQDMNSYIEKLDGKIYSLRNTDHRANGYCKCLEKIKELIEEELIEY